MPKSKPGNDMHAETVLNAARNAALEGGVSAIAYGMEALLPTGMKQLIMTYCNNLFSPNVTPAVPVDANTCHTMFTFFLMPFTTCLAKDEKNLPRILPDDKDIDAWIKFRSVDLTANKKNVNPQSVWEKPSAPGHAMVKQCYAEAVAAAAASKYALDFSWFGMSETELSIFFDGWLVSHLLVKEAVYCKSSTTMAQNCEKMCALCGLSIKPQASAVSDAMGVGCYLRYTLPILPRSGPAGPPTAISSR